MKWDGVGSCEMTLGNQRQDGAAYAKWTGDARALSIFGLGEYLGFFLD